MPAWPEYSASKFALVGMSEAWRGEFEPVRHRRAHIVPGLTNSGFDKKLIRKDGRRQIRFDRG